MNTFNEQFQPLADLASASAKLWLDTARENFTAGFDLAEKALAVRDFDGARKLAQASAVTTRDSLERVVSANQQTFADVSALAKTQAELIREQTQSFGKGFSLPNVESMFDPKTYGLDTPAKSKTKRS